MSIKENKTSCEQCERGGHGRAQAGLETAGKRVFGRMFHARRPFLMSEPLLDVDLSVDLRIQRAHRLFEFACIPTIPYRPSRVERAKISANRASTMRSRSVPCDLKMQAHPISWPRVSQRYAGVAQLDVGLQK